MNATRSQIITQYERAKRLGWIPHFLAAEKQHTKGYFDAADLMGIGSRETNLDPKWLKKAGDGGHGYGLMQADDRSFPGWIATGEWHNAESGIHKGAEILMMKWRDMEACVGKRVTVKGKGFTGPKLYGFKAQQAVISSYNCGRWALYAAANGKDVDAYSTGHDYSLDVITRARIFRELLTRDKQVSAVESAPQVIPPKSLDNQSVQNPSVTGQPPISQEVQQAIVAPPIADGPVTVVPQVSAEPTEDKKPGGIRGSIAAAVAFVTSIGSGFFSLFAGLAPVFVISFFSAGAVIGAVFVVMKMRNDDRQKTRDDAAREAREARAQEIQMAMIHAAADKTKNTVRVVPTPIANSDVPNTEAT
jgi:hypothetical protein